MGTGHPSPKVVAGPGPETWFRTRHNTGTRRGRGPAAGRGRWSPSPGRLVTSADGEEGSPTPWGALPRVAAFLPVPWARPYRARPAAGAGAARPAVPPTHRPSF